MERKRVWFTTWLRLGNLYLEWIAAQLPIPNSLTPNLRRSV